MISDLANGNRLAFVSKSESAELGVVGEALNTDKLRGLNERDDLLAPLRELWRFARLAAGRFVEVVKQRLHDSGLDRTHDGI